ncbi:hypothetical protein [Vibrio sp. V19_P1S1T109]|nr:hypothetical protein [Vibrio sp. V19_P1S1T109]
MGKHKPVAKSITASKRLGGDVLFAGHGQFFLRTYHSASVAIDRDRAIEY